MDKVRLLDPIDSFALFRIANIIGIEEMGQDAWLNHSQKWLDADMGEDEKLMLEWLSQREIPKHVLDWIDREGFTHVLKFLGDENPYRGLLYA